MACVETPSAVARGYWAALAHSANDPGRRETQCAERKAGKHTAASRRRGSTPPSRQHRRLGKWRNLAASPALTKIYERTRSSPRFPLLIRPSAGTERKISALADDDEALFLIYRESGLPRLGSNRISIDWDAIPSPVNLQPRQLACSAGRRFFGPHRQRPEEK